MLQLLAGSDGHSYVAPFPLHRLTRPWLSPFAVLRHALYGTSPHVPTLLASLISLRSTQVFSSYSE